VTPLEFAQHVLDRLGFPLSDNNIRALVAVQAIEGGHNNGASFNPMNTSQPMDGSHVWHVLSPSTGFGIQAYTSWEQRPPLRVSPHRSPARPPLRAPPHRSPAPRSPETRPAAPAPRKRGPRFPLAAPIFPRYAPRCCDSFKWGRSPTRTPGPAATPRQMAPRAGPADQRV
jgi:hypothetical protein